MASFTGVGDNIVLDVPRENEQVAVAISGTYSMTIALQREVGSKASGAFEELKRWSTANATVAHKYYTRTKNERLRLIVLVDTSGTATATLTNPIAEKVAPPVTDSVGNVKLGFDENGIYSTGDIRSDTSVYQRRSPVTVGATETLTAADHAGKIITLSTLTGQVITLPAATGTGNLYRFYVAATVTSNDYVIQVANATDVIQGVITVVTDTGGLTVPTAATTDTITMNGTTTGGVIGGWLEIEDVASGQFSVRGGLNATGAEATPFSADVS